MGKLHSTVIHSASFITLQSILKAATLQTWDPTNPDSTVNSSKIWWWLQQIEQWKWLVIHDRITGNCYSIIDCIPYGLENNILRAANPGQIVLYGDDRTHQLARTEGSHACHSDLQDNHNVHS